MMINNFFRLFFLVALFGCFAFFLSSCTAHQHLAKKNLAFLYNTKGSSLRCSAKVIKHDSAYYLQLHLRNSDLKYTLNEIGRNYRSQLKIETAFYPEIKDAKAINCGEFFVEDSLNFMKDVALEYEFPLYLQDTLPGFMVVDFVDVLANNSLRKSMYIYPLSGVNPHDVQIFDVSGTSLVEDFLLPNHQYLVKLNTVVHKLTLEFSKDRSAAAKPPFVLKNQENPLDIDNVEHFEPGFDSVFTFTSLPEVGTYFLRDSEHNILAVWKNFGTNFPAMTNYEQMLMPLRYIASNDEFDALLSNKFPLDAIESFWLNLNQDNDLMRSGMVKNYYAAVENANLYFSESKPGWKSDRGMLYIVFGKPDFVYKNNHFEEWWYGEPGDSRSLFFRFNKVILRQGVLDYELERSPEFKYPWLMNVEKWRR